MGKNLCLIFFLYEFYVKYPFPFKPWPTSMGICICKIPQFYLIYLLGGFKSSLKMKFEKVNAHIMPVLADNKTINPCPLFFLTLVF